MSDRPDDPATRTGFERDLADRLRALAAHAPTNPTTRGGKQPELLSATGPIRRTGSARGVARLAAVATLTAAAAGGLVWLSRSSATVDTATGFAVEGEVPSGFGTWSPAAAAPIPTRSWAATAWTGEEAVFWAGANLTRGMAFGDGAAYDPDTDAWRELPTPGWGHPGLGATYLDGRIYATAKGGAVRLDPATGEATDLATPDDLVLATMVAVDGSLYGIGPRGWEAEAAREIGIARYRPDADTWEAAVFSVMIDEPGEADGLFPFLVRWPVLWTGEEIVVWFPNGASLAHDPVRDTWLEPPALVLPDGAAVGAATGATVAGVAGGRVLALAADPERAGQARVARLDEDRWSWSDEPLPIGVGESTTVAEAGDWLAVFSPDDPPVVIHGPSGAWQVVEDGPRVEAPNTVWTGDRLIVWGGYGTEGSHPSGASSVWTPPHD